LQKDSTSFNIAKKLCKDYIATKYIIDKEQIHCINLEGPNVSDLVIIEYVDKKYVMRQSTDEEYGIYFREIRDLAAEETYE